MQKVIKLIWTPSHVGIKCKGKADQTTKEAALSNLDVSPLYVKSDIQKWRRRQIKSSWTGMWLNGYECVQTLT